MTNTWTCECGSIQPLIHRYCSKCGRPIPQSVLDTVIKEETKGYRKNKHKK